MPNESETLTSFEFVVDGVKGFFILVLLEISHDLNFDSFASKIVKQQLQTALSLSVDAT